MSKAWDLPVARALSVFDGLLETWDVGTDVNVVKAGDHRREEQERTAGGAMYSIGECGEMERRLTTSQSLFRTGPRCVARACRGQRRNGRALSFRRQLYKRVSRRRRKDEEGCDVTSQCPKEAEGGAGTHPSSVQMDYSVSATTPRALVMGFLTEGPTGWSRRAHLSVGRSVAHSIQRTHRQTNHIREAFSCAPVCVRPCQSRHVSVTPTRAFP